MAMMKMAPAAMLELKDGNPTEDEREFMDAVKALREKVDAVEAKATTAAETLENMDAADRGSVEKLQNALDAQEKRWAEAAKAADVEAQVAEVKAQLEKLTTAVNRTGPGTKPRSEQETKELVNNWGAAVFHRINDGEANEVQAKALQQVQRELKALNLGDNTEGGYTAPVELMAGIVKDLVEVSEFRPLVSIRQTANRQVQFMYRTQTAAAVRVAERGSRTSTQTPKWGIKEATVHELYARMEVTEQMLEDSAFDLQAELRMEASEQFAYTEGVEFVSGSGVDEAEGILSNGDVGEIVTGHATELTGDSIINLAAELKTGYVSNARYLANRKTIRDARLLKDGAGQYLWQPGLQGGNPALLNGSPYSEMPAMPDVGAGTYPIAFGNFRTGYIWWDRILMQMQRDPFTQADAGAVVFRFRKRSTGRVRQAEAIKKLKVSA